MTLGSFPPVTLKVSLYLKGVNNARDLSQIPFSQAIIYLLSLAFPEYYGWSDALLTVLTYKGVQFSHTTSCLTNPGYDLKLKEKVTLYYFPFIQKMRSMKFKLTKSDIHIQFYLYHI